MHCLPVHLILGSALGLEPTETWETLFPSPRSSRLSWEDQTCTHEQANMCLMMPKAIIKGEWWSSLRLPGTTCARLSKRAPGGKLGMFPLSTMMGGCTGCSASFQPSPLPRAASAHSAFSEYLPSPRLSGRKWFCGSLAYDIEGPHRMTNHLKKQIYRSMCGFVWGSDQLGSCQYSPWGTNNGLSHSFSSHVFVQLWSS